MAHSGSDSASYCTEQSVGPFLICEISTLTAAPSPAGGGRI